MHEDMLDKVRSSTGFLAALDQSGGSTPKALLAYGIEESEYDGDNEMFDMVHAMRSRIITSPAFDGDRVLGAILFEMTMDREIEGQGSAAFLWNNKGVVPFLKCDQGLADEVDGAQVMKGMPDLDALLERGVEKGMFGTKMRSVVKQANAAGIDAVVDQQFEIGLQILGHGLMPIIEPEVDIHSPTKVECEEMLKAAIHRNLDALDDGTEVMLKLSLPSIDNFYADLIDHPKVLKVVALSGGYSRDEANARLAQNSGMIASFSRALSEGLSAQQTDAEFDAALAASVDSIHKASVAG